MPKEMMLTGDLLKLKEGIFDKGQRLTSKEWAKALFKSTDLIAIVRIRNRIARLASHGYIAIPVPADPDKPQGAGLYTPLTETREVARLGNKRVISRMNTAILRFGLYATEEMALFPDMKPEIINAFKETTEALTGHHKLSIEQARYEQRQLSSRTG